MLQPLWPSAFYHGIGEIANTFVRIGNRLVVNWCASLHAINDYRLLEQEDRRWSWGWGRGGAKLGRWHTGKGSLGIL